MTLQKAIKSKRPFRRKHHIEQYNNKFWLIAQGNFIIIKKLVTGSYTLTNDDVLAEDWEVEGIVVTIDENRFREMLDNALKAGHGREGLNTYLFKCQLWEDLFGHDDYND